MAKRTKDAELPLSPVANRLLEAAVDIQQNPDATDKAYMARQLVQCTLPHSDPGNEVLWTLGLHARAGAESAHQGREAE